jgi:hypothetical protein
VESPQRIPKADDVLLEFAGAPTRVTESQLRDILFAAGVASAALPSTVAALRDVSFVGLLTSDDDDHGSAVFTDSPREKQRADVLARRLASGTGGEITYLVHPAFWAYLEMQRGDRTLSLGV